MTMPTQGEARSRQTAYLATEHWWRSRVEKLRDQMREAAGFCRKVASVNDREPPEAIALESCAAELDALIAERNHR